MYKNAHGFKNTNLLLTKTIQQLKCKIEMKIKIILSHYSIINKN